MPVATSLRVHNQNITGPEINRKKNSADKSAMRSAGVNERLFRYSQVPPARIGAEMSMVIRVGIIKSIPFDFGLFKCLHR